MPASHLHGFRLSRHNPGRVVENAAVPRIDGGERAGMGVGGERGGRKTHIATPQPMANKLAACLSPDAPVFAGAQHGRVAGTELVLVVEPALFHQQHGRRGKQHQAARHHLLGRGKRWVRAAMRAAGRGEGGGGGGERRCCARRESVVWTARGSSVKTKGDCAGAQRQQRDERV